MSLQLVNNLSNEIETIVDVDRNSWFKRVHVEKFWGIEDFRSSLNGLDKCEMRIRKDFNPTYQYPIGWPGPKDQQNKTDIFLSKQGLLHVINKCRKPTPNLINLTKCLRIELRKNKWLYKEQDTSSQIIQAFNADEMIHRFGVEKYRIDLYLPRYMLAIECDEFDHRDRDIGYDVDRQKQAFKAT